MDPPNRIKINSCVGACSGSSAKLRSQALVSCSRRLTCIREMIGSGRMDFRIFMASALCCMAPLLSALSQVLPSRTRRWALMRASSSACFIGFLQLGLLCQALHSPAVLWDQQTAAGHDQGQQVPFIMKQI